MRFATVRRVEAIDAMSEGMRAQRNLLPRDLPDDYFDHLQALVRIVEHDQVGIPRVVCRTTGADDYAQAEVYDTVAAALWSYQQDIETALRDEFAPLDDLLDFPRSQLADYDADVSYSPGPPEPEDGYGWR